MFNSKRMVWYKLLFNFEQKIILRYSSPLSKWNNNHNCISPYNLKWREAIRSKSVFRILTFLIFIVFAIFFIIWILLNRFWYFSVRVAQRFLSRENKTSLHSLTWNTIDHTECSVSFYFFFYEHFSSILYEGGAGVALEQMLCKMLEEQMKQGQPGANTPFTPSARINPKVWISFQEFPRVETQRVYFKRCQKRVWSTL